jgi:hypothetical protein
MSRILSFCEKRMICGNYVSAKRELRPLMDNGLSCDGKTGIGYLPVCCLDGNRLK